MSTPSDADETLGDETFGEQDSAPEGEAGREEIPLPTFPGYTIVEQLGMGGFGVVYRARDEKLQREVAIKVHLRSQEIDPDVKERFLGEARALARVRHPHVLVIHSALEHDGAIGLVTEFIDGQPLSDRIEEGGPLGAAEAAQMGAVLCRALAAVHGADQVHRDVKTSNILRERGGRLILADFGLGVVLTEGKEIAPGNLVAGSPLFMAPEQIRGAGVDRRTDLYALGVVLYHLTTGRFPVENYNLKEIFHNISCGTLVPIRDARPDLPEGFATVVRTAMAVAPEERYQTAGEMEQALLATLGTDSRNAANGDSSPPRYDSTRPRRSRRGRRLATAGVALTLCAAAVLAFLWNRSTTSFRVERAALQLVRDNELQELADRDRIGVGDRLQLEFQADSQLWVYVFNEDRLGNRYLLFPLPGGDLQNPLPGGIRHRLPGSLGGDSVDWQPDSRGTEESFFILASASQRPELEALLASAAKGGGSLSHPRLATDEVAALVRGVGGLARRTAPTSDLKRERTLRALVERLDSEPATQGQATDIWMKSITLLNP